MLSAVAVLVILAIGLASYALGFLVFSRSKTITASQAECVATAHDGSTYGLQPDQAVIASQIASVAIGRGLPDYAVTVAIATAMQESRLTNLGYGDADSLGAFQQRPSMGWGTAEQVMDVSYAAGIFYDHLLKIPGWQTMRVTEAAQAVQRSAFPERYGDWEPMARAWAAALTGEQTSAISCSLEPVSGTAASRLKAEVQTAFPDATLAKTGDNAENGELEYTLTLASVAQADEATRSRAIWQAASWLMVRGRAYGITRMDAGGMRWMRTGERQQWQKIPDDANDRNEPALSSNAIAMVLG